MFKKLDLLIFKSFIGPFIITFFIALFVLIMQSLWKYIDDLVGKGLDLLTIAQFVWYASATLIILAMPIAILISSIMTFGNLGESFELVAIKSSGISLLRFMRPLILFTLLLCIITFLFANYVMPYSQLKFATLYRDILVKKPALDLKQGSFYTGIDKYAIRVGKKADDGNNIEKVLIYDQTNLLQDNTIMAKKGKMQATANGNFLAFNLENGNRYQERGNVADTATEYISLEFKTFKKLFDLSAFNGSKTDEDAFRKNFKMLSAKQLSYNIDSLKKLNDSTVKVSIVSVKSALPYLNDYAKKNTITTNLAKSDSVIFPANINSLLEERALSKANEIKNTLQFIVSDNFNKKDILVAHKVEWHKKFSFSLACMVLFFIGAPLGSIIRKGGLGMPLVVAIIFFLIFHLLNVFGEKFSYSQKVSPIAGMWFAIFILAPVGIFLTYKAMHDSQIFNKEVYNKLFKKLKSKLAFSKIKSFKNA
jgi:lipopolysaccharide export system permease protein